MISTKINPVLIRRNQIINLINEGYSINKISRLLNVNKSTIYYHYKKIKGKLKKEVTIKKDDSLIGEFMGLFAGDGCFYKTKQYQYRIYLFFNITGKEYVKNLINILFNLFNKKPYVFKRKNVLIILYTSKDIYNLIKEFLIWDKNKRKAHTISLINKNYSKKFKISFLRGCVDSDGYISNKKINFATSSPSLAKNIRNFLNDLNINFCYSIYKEKRPNRVDMHHIDIRKSERNRFFNIIDPRNLKNINVRRPGLSNPRFEPSLYSNFWT